MASMGNGFAKCFILFMAIVILLQGVVYLGLSIWGVTFRECHDVEEFGSNPFKFAMELIYFSEAVVEATVVETLQPETQPQYLVETQYPEQIRPKPLPIFIPSEQMQRQDSQQYRAGDRTTLQSPVMVLPPQQQQEPTAPQQTPQREVLSPLPDINTYRTTEAHPDRLNYPPVESPLARAPSPAVQQLAVNSALNNRYSEMYPTPPANPRVSEELRNQMPWSYTSMVTKPPPPPRKPQLQVQIYPQIPEPDYAEH
ncbi:GL22465 [Drosophila persimilis]|uniref:GL22465 n=1 Tax=Drosophila persimilis TaxID=7234 RepID=B4H1J3_DROPE|nr:GL22465 [Drosophila persimilis]